MDVWQGSKYTSAVGKYLKMLVEELIKGWVLDWTETSLKTHRFIGIFVRHTAIKTNYFQQRLQLATQRL